MRKVIMSTLLSVQMFPTVAILITLYTFFVQFHLTNTYIGLILACLCVSLPIVLVFIAFQRFLISGMTAGAVKE